MRRFPHFDAMRRVTPPRCVGFPIFDTTGRAISFSLFSMQRGGLTLPVVLVSPFSDAMRRVTPPPLRVVFPFSMQRGGLTLRFSHFRRNEELMWPGGMKPSSSRRTPLFNMARRWGNPPCRIEHPFSTWFPLPRHVENTSLNMEVSPIFFCLRTQRGGFLLLVTFFSRFSTQRGGFPPPLCLFFSFYATERFPPPLCFLFFVTQH